MYKIIIGLSKEKVISELNEANQQGYKIVSSALEDAGPGQTRFVYTMKNDEEVKICNCGDDKVDNKELEDANVRLEEALVLNKQQITSLKAIATENKVLEEDNKILRDDIVLFKSEIEKAKAELVDNRSAAKKPTAKKQNN